MKSKNGLLLSLMFVSLFYYGQASAEKTLEPREKLLMDFNWRFHLGDFDAWKQVQDTLQDVYASVKSRGYLKGTVASPDFNDSSWEKINIPHDFVMLGKYSKDNKKAKGFLPGGIGWYRKYFDVSAEDKGKRIYLEFDGVFRDCTVYLNGFLVGGNKSGYASFRFDVTDMIACGDKNYLAVRVDATKDEGWWYEGGGIYRHVWLLKTNALHVAPWGVFVMPQVEEGAGKPAKVKIQTKVLNKNENEEKFKVGSVIYGPDGNKVVDIFNDTGLETWGENTIEQEVEVANPALWSIESPNLYKLVTTIEKEGGVIDRVETTFGIRSIRFDPNKGFFLNGKNVKINGMCNHQDHAGVGIAVPDRLFEFRIKKLKEMGCNAYRTAHSQHAVEVLDECDSQGTMVLAEPRLTSSAPEEMKELETLVLTGRNHPCVIIWNLANEEVNIQGDGFGKNILVSMKHLVKKLDPSRLVTTAQNEGFGTGFTGVVDVIGINYNYIQYDLAQRDFPKKSIIATENSGAVFTRGIYFADKEKGYMTAYDTDFVPWGVGVESTIKMVNERPYIGGGFLWTGFDYRGEPTPLDWPCISSHFGNYDYCGFPKDIVYYFKAWWGDKPVLHIFPHWNWKGREGQEINVWCYSNLDEVELFVNGKSQGKQKMMKDSHLEWKVKYVLGTLEAKGYKNKELVETKVVETTGEPSGIVLIPDRASINADGEDLSIITVQVVDDKGQLVPVANNEISFSVGGKGKLLGLGNGDPADHGNDKGTERKVFGGLCQAIIQAEDHPGEITIKASAPGLKTAELKIISEKAVIRPRSN